MELAGAVSAIEVGLTVKVCADSRGAMVSAQRPIKAKLKSELPIFIEISSKESGTKLILGFKRTGCKRALDSKTGGDAGGIQQ